MGFLDCRASAGFLTRYERELREPLVWRQGSQVPMRWLYNTAPSAKNLIWHSFKLPINPGHFSSLSHSLKYSAENCKDLLLLPLLIQKGYLKTLQVNILCFFTVLAYIEPEFNLNPYIYFREGNGTPLQYSCLENPMDGGAC